MNRNHLAISAIRSRFCCVWWIDKHSNREHLRWFNWGYSLMSFYFVKRALTGDHLSVPRVNQWNKTNFWSGRRDTGHCMHSKCASFYLTPSRLYPEIECVLRSKLAHWSAAVANSFGRRLSYFCWLAGRVRRGRAPRSQVLFSRLESRTRKQKVSGVVFLHRTFWVGAILIT